MGEDRTDAHSSGRGGDRLTIAEAATLLGVHKNTVRNRIKNGLYRAEMVQTERGPTYLIERESLLTNLSTNTLSSASQELVSQQAMEFVQELLRPFVSELGEIREELGAERVRREMAESTLRAGMAEEQRRREEAERERDYLRRELFALREPRESPQTVEEEPQRAEPRSATEGAQEGTERPQQRSGWLAPVDKLPWWQYLLGLLAVFALTVATAFIAETLNNLPYLEDVRGLVFLVIFSPIFVSMWLLPGIFGFWVGGKVRGSSGWRSRWLRAGLPGVLSGIVVMVGLALGIELADLETWEGVKEVVTTWRSLIPEWTLVMGLPATILYISGVLIGNGRQRRRAERVYGEIPARPALGTNWTPRNQAILGFAGTLIAAMISLTGTVITIVWGS